MTSLAARGPLNPGRDWYDHHNGDDDDDDDSSIGGSKDISSDEVKWWSDEEQDFELHEASVAQSFDLPL